MNYYKIFLLMLSVIIHCGFAYAEYSADVLLRMTIDSLSYDVKADTASARGVGKILQADGQGLLSARRVAINDARRGLLILKRGLLEGKTIRPESVSGNVPPFTILSEDARDGLYFVDIEVTLSDLMDEEGNKERSKDILW